MTEYTRKATWTGQAEFDGMFPAPIYTYRRDGDDPHPKDVVVMYHHGCADGMGAAWAVHHYMQTRQFEATRCMYVPVLYDNVGSTVDALVRTNAFKDAIVLVVDFSLSHADATRIMDAGAEFLDVYDHHASAKESVNSMNTIPNGRGVFADDMSGAVIAWTQLMGEESPTPMMLLYIQDRDLWKFKFIETDPFITSLFSRGLSLVVLDDIYNGDIYIDDMVKEGRAIIRARDTNIRQSLEKGMTSTASLVTDDGVKHIGLVNVPYYLASNTGNAMLALDANIDAALCYMITGSEVKLSFRAREGGTDVSKIAAMFGGGGHRAAAGASMTLKEFMDTFIAAPEDSGKVVTIHNNEDK